MTHINRFFFADMSLKNKTVTKAMLVFFVLSHQKIFQFIYA